MSGGRVQYCHEIISRTDRWISRYTLSDLWRNIQVYTRTRVGFLKVVGTSESPTKCVSYANSTKRQASIMAIQRFFMNFEEVFVGSNGVSYKHKYFLARLMDPVAGNAGNATNETQAKEISCTRWLTFTK
jgi:hypothetical protein